MSSYISSYSISSALRQSVLNAQKNLATAEQEVSTGTYANVGLQLGESTNQDLSLRSEESMLETITATNGMVSTRLSSTQTILGNLQTNAQDFLNSLISSTGTSSANSLQATAQVDLQSLVSNLNTSVSGQYIFGGINSGTQPITDYYASGSPNQAAVDSAFSSTFGFSQSSASVSSITGTQMQSFLNTQFPTLFQGSNWTSDWSSASDTAMSSQISDTQTADTSVSANQSAFQDLAQAYAMVANLGTQNLSADALNAVTTTATALVQKAITGLTNMQTSVGLVQSNVSNATDQMSVQMSILTTQINNLEDVDPYEASTQVTNLQTQIETAYSLTAQLQKLSLVNYL
ncbi:MAG: flagellar hook-associated family protein [Beijerinckiaceae bacterium]|nr:MAG: flagellar hook-associated family protein [Beijerinckiaceae bacterium]